MKIRIKIGEVHKQNCGVYLQVVEINSHQDIIVKNHNNDLMSVTQKQLVRGEVPYSVAHTVKHILKPLPKPSRAPDYRDSAVVKNNHYVYAAYELEDLLYIGHGKGNRYKHCNSGRSSNKNLNNFFFKGAIIHTEFLETNLSRDRAIELEKHYIKILKPVCNINN